MILPVQGEQAGAAENLLWFKSQLEEMVGTDFPGPGAPALSGTGFGGLDGFFQGFRFPHEGAEAGPGFGEFFLEDFGFHAQGHRFIPAGGVDFLGDPGIRRAGGGLLEPGLPPIFPPEQDSDEGGEGEEIDQ